MLALDASMALAACLSESGFALFADQPLVAPPLLWSEARSVLHERVWRGDLTRAAALAALERLGRAPLTPRSPARLNERTWEIADRLGWAKTCDAEYLALASLLECRLVTVDERMRRGAARLGFVIGPTEI